VVKSTTLKRKTLNWAEFQHDTYVKEFFFKCIWNKQAQLKKTVFKKGGGWGEEGTNTPDI